MTPNDPLDLSIIITTYNRRQLLQEVVESVLGKLTCTYEIIIIDDGSTDDTRAYLAALGAPCRVVLAEHGGVQAARNLGTGLAQGRYLKFTDDDDVLDPEAVSSQVAYMEQHPEIGVGYSDWMFVARTKEGKIKRWFYTMSQIDDPVGYLIMDWWCPLFVYLFRADAVRGLVWDTSFRVLTDMRFVVEAALNGVLFGYHPTAPLSLGSYRALLPRQQRISLAASNAVRTERELEIMQRMQSRLERDKAWTPFRIEVLAGRYFGIARRIFPEDKRLFRALIKKTLALQPTFQPEGKRYRQLIRWFGYAHAERLRRFSLRLREGYRALRPPPQSLSPEGSSPDDIIPIISTGRTVVPKF